MQILNSNIKQGTLNLTIDGTTFKFASVINITPTTAKTLDRIKDMQGTGFVDYPTNNQQPDTCDFTIKPIKADEFEVLNRIWNNGLAFDLIFINNKDASSVSFLSPAIKQQPVHTSIEEGDTTFEVKLMIMCNAIEYK